VVFFPEWFEFAEKVSSRSALLHLMHTILLTDSQPGRTALSVGE